MFRGWACEPGAAILGRGQTTRRWRAVAEWVLGRSLRAILAAAILPIGSEASELRTTLVVSSSRSELLHAEIWVLDVRSGVRRNLSRTCRRP